MNKIVPQRLLHEGLFLSEKKYPYKIAVIAEGVPYTFNDLVTSVEKLANSMIINGFKRGDRCVIFMDNSWECVVSIYATLVANGVFVVVNSQTKKEKLRYILNDCSASVFITDANLYGVFNPVLKNVNFLNFIICSGDISRINNKTINSFEDILNTSSKIEISTLNIANDLSALIYTSGSTGVPKGVMQTHLSMTFTLESLIEYLRLSNTDKILLVLPLSFDYGLYQLLMSVQLGATLVLERSFSYPAQIFNRIKEVSVTVFPGVPTIYSMIISMHRRNKLIFPTITRLTNTAATLPTEYNKFLKEVFPFALIYKMYGLTECKRVCYLEPELLDKKPSSVGKAIPGTEVFLLNQDLKKVKALETGMLYVRGPHIMRGYWNQKELSNEVLIDGEIPGEKLLCTKDWFKMDSDGDLYFLGRSDDIIKTRGEKVSPAEVENVVLGIQGVKEVAVIGVPDDVFGEAVKCFVVIDKNIESPGRVIRKVCAENLESFMIPKYIEIVESLPKTNTGKISKLGLK